MVGFRDKPLIVYHEKMFYFPGILCGCIPHKGVIIFMGKRDSLFMGGTRLFLGSLKGAVFDDRPSQTDTPSRLINDDSISY